MVIGDLLDGLNRRKRREGGVIRRSKFSGQDYRMRRAILHLLAKAGTTDDVPLAKTLASEITREDSTAAFDEKRLASGELPISDLAKQAIEAMKTRTP